MMIKMLQVAKTTKIRNCNTPELSLNMQTVAGRSSKIYKDHLLYGALDLFCSRECVHRQTDATMKSLRL